MRVIADYNAQEFPPKLSLYIHGAPHRRMHISVISQYREIIRAAFTKAGIKMPIDHPIDLYVHFVDPSSPDLDNLLTALYQAMDGRTLTRNTILVDDGLIQAVSMSKAFPNRDSNRADRNLHRLMFGDRAVISA